LARPIPRLRVMLIIIAVMFSLAAGKAVQVQAIDADAIAAEAAKQITTTVKIPALRGTITDRNGEVLAFSESTVTVIADPEMIRTNGKFDEAMTDADREVAATAPGRLAELIATYAGGDAADYLPALTKENTRYSIVVKHVSQENYTMLRAAMSESGLIGLSKENTPSRRYPGGTVASNVIGFTNSEGVGAGGLEYSLNETLTGVDGSEMYEVSPNGRIPTGTSVLVPAQNGQDYQLTLDAGLQLQVEQVLANRVNKTRANYGMAVVMNVKTGEILALANYPTFDSNKAGEAEASELSNRAITDPYTPGSVQKTLTFAALLDAGLVRADDVVEVPGQIKSGNSYIHDAWSHGTVQFYARGILAKSSNIGTIKLARKMDKQTLLGYYVSFGLGQKTNIGLPGESSGVLPTGNIEDYTRDGIAFGGSGLSVTLIQEAAAVAAIANGGVYNPPYLIASTTVDGAMAEIPRDAPHRVVSEDAAAEVVSMMEAMEVNTSSSVFDIDGYRSGTKTGTARKFNSKCNCFKGLVVSTVGIAPAENPQLLAYVVIDEPQQGTSGQGVAGPAYQDIMSIALARYSVPPSTTKSPKLPIYPSK
jgi:cell division protein FtsI (penicillin-binding protein 3)